MDENAARLASTVATESRGLIGRRVKSGRRTHAYSLRYISRVARLEEEVTKLRKKLMVAEKVAYVS